MARPVREPSHARPPAVAQRLAARSEAKRSGAIDAVPWTPDDHRMPPFPTRRAPAPVIFVPTAIEDVVVVRPQAHADERGLFARTFCAREFEAAGLSPVVAQANVSFNHRAGTLRGLHFQRPPAQEAKLVRCTRGRVFDVAVDVRPSSPTYLRHVGVVLDADERNALYVPEGFAHGYLTLEDASEVAYQVSEFYAPGVEAGLRWDDPTLGIAWPGEVRVISDKDAGWPLLDPAAPRA